MRGDRVPNPSFFLRLYKEAAARAAAAPDDDVIYSSQQYSHGAVQSYDDDYSYSGPQPTKRPVGGPAPADAVQKATEEFNRSVNRRLTGHKAFSTSVAWPG